MIKDSGRTLYLVVHGVGDPSPGETLREYAQGLTYDGAAASLTEEMHWVPEPDPTGSDVRTVRAFPVHALRDDRGGDIFAEVHWADLSRFPISLFGLAEGLFSILFGLRYVAYQAVNGLEAPGAKLLRDLGRWSTSLIIGPLAASNLLLFFLLIAAAVTDQIKPGSFAQAPHGDRAGALACLAAIALGFGLWWRFSRHSVPRLIGLSLIGVTGLVLGLVVAWSTFSTVDVWEISTLPEFRKALLGPGPPSGPSKLAPDGGLVLYAACTSIPMLASFLAIVLILSATPAVLLFLRWNDHREHARNSAMVATVLPFLMMFGWGLVIPATWAVLGQFLPGSPEFHRTYRLILIYGAPFLPFWMFLLLGLAIATGLVFLRWSRRSSRLAQAKGLPRVDDGARLIVAPWLIWAIAVGYAIIVALMLIRFSPLRNLPSLVSLNIWLKSRTDPVWGPIIAFLAAAVPLLLSRFFPYLRAGLDLVYDVINHFHFSFRDLSALRPAARPEATDFPIRRAIAHRLSATISHFSGRLTGPDQPSWRLVVLSHSQGTVVAIDVLNDQDLEAVFGRFASVRLVTMGSPFSHIYQHYFRHHYPELGCRHWETLAGRLAVSDAPASWINVYRVDDYVGRVIDGSRPGLLENYPTTPRGHVGYWVDREVLGVLSGKDVI